jgi:hypothetical protein
MAAMKLFKIRVGALLAIVLGASVAHASQQPRGPKEIGWVGLYSDALIEWLENENRLEALCGALRGDAHDRCREEKLRPQPFIIPLHSAPNGAGRRAGSLLLLATPGKGMRWFYSSPRGGQPREFEPDLAMQDWGYGPYYHQTYLERHGSWFLLPRDPFPEPTWFNATDLGDRPHVLDVPAIVDAPQGTLVILAIERDSIRAREEQPADMWCQSGEPPRLKPSTELRIPKSELYDHRGHLLISPAYMKGC